MEAEILDNLLLMGELHEHRVARMLNRVAEFVNKTNKITVKIISDKELQIMYNVFNETKIEIIPGTLIYEFFDELLKRKEAVEITLKYGILIDVRDWKGQLQPSLLRIQEEKNYDRYLKHLKLTTERFDVEYFDGIVVIKDKEKQLLNNALRIEKALQQCI